MSYWSIDPIRFFSFQPYALMATLYDAILAQCVYAFVHIFFFLLKDCKSVHYMNRKVLIRNDRLLRLGRFSATHDLSPLDGIRKITQ
jgi:hypothetical protein